MALLNTCWDGEWDTRNFDILIDGVEVATQRLRINQPGDFFEVVNAIPPALTKDKAKVTVRFQAPPGDTAGGLFGLRMMRADAAGSEGRK